MKVNLGNLGRSSVDITKHDYLILGIVSRLDACESNSVSVVRNTYDLLKYLHKESPEFPELNSLVLMGYTLIFRNSIPECNEIHSYLTPIENDLVLPVDFNDNKELAVYRDPSKFDGETYVVEVRYSPEASASNFCINLPSGRSELHKDSEFVSSIIFFTGSLPESVDSYNEVLDVKVGGSNLSEVFDEICQFLNNDPDEGGYFRDFMASNAVNDAVKGIFRFSLNTPLRYLPKSIYPSQMGIIYDLGINIEYLRDYVPDRTITFKSKLVGDSTGISISQNNGKLIVKNDYITEEFDVSGDKLADNFIGNIQSKLIDVVINSSEYNEFPLYSFESNFIQVRSLRSIPINVTESIRNLIQSEFLPNIIIASDSLVEIDQRTQFPVDEFVDEILILGSEVPNQWVLTDLSNTLRFVGKLGEYPSYVKFLDSLYKCSYSNVTLEVPSELDTSNLDPGIWYPTSSEFYNVLNQGTLSRFNSDLGLGIDKISIYQLIYSVAIGKFITRNKYKYLHTTNPIGVIKTLLTDFQSKFSSIKLLEVTSVNSVGNSINITLSTKLESILGFSELKLNFNLEI